MSSRELLEAFGHSTPFPVFAAAFPMLVRFRRAEPSRVVLDYEVRSLMSYFQPSRRYLTWLFYFQASLLACSPLSSLFPPLRLVRLTCTS